MDSSVKVGDKARSKPWIESREWWIERSKSWIESQEPWIERSKPWIEQPDRRTPPAQNPKFHR